MMFGSNRDFLANYSQPVRRVRPMFVTFVELQALVYSVFPHFALFQWLDAELHDLYMLGAPDPNPANEGKRLILPGQYQKWAHEVAQKMSTEILKSHG